jgi:hypothetical protein
MKMTQVAGHVLLLLQWILGLVLVMLLVLVLRWVGGGTLDEQKQPSVLLLQHSCGRCRRCHRMVQCWS